MMEPYSLKQEFKTAEKMTNQEVYQKFLRISPDDLKKRGFLSGGSEGVYSWLVKDYKKEAGLDDIKEYKEAGLTHIGFHNSNGERPVVIHANFHECIEAAVLELTELLGLKAKGGLEAVWQTQLLV